MRSNESVSQVKAEVCVFFLARHPEVSSLSRLVRFRAVDTLAGSGCTIQSL